MTKAQQIMKLYDELRANGHREWGLPAVIAKEVACHESYVRVVARQRRGRSKSDADLRYLSSPLGRQAYDRARAARCARHRAQRSGASVDEVRASARAAYRAKAQEQYG